MLPFVHLSAEGDQAYLGDGIAEEILTALVKMTPLKVSWAATVPLRHQEALRRRNRNESQTTSSHEFATTFDIAYLNFAAPRVIEDPSAGRLDARLRAYALMRLDTIGTRYAPHLEGELGAVLQEMQREGTLLTLRERSQPVYHITIVRR